MVYIVPGFKEGCPHIQKNMRLFLYPADDIEAYCMEAEAILDTPHERRRCGKLDIETEEIKEGNACVLRIMGYINGERVDDQVIWRTVERVMSYKERLPKDHRNPKFEFRYQSVPEMALFEINI